VNRPADGPQADLAPGGVALGHRADRPGSWSKTTRAARLAWLAATLAAVLLAYALYVLGDQPLVWDAAIYYRHGMQLARQGVFGFFDPLRTYGYPLFLALIPLFSGDHSDNVRFVAFNLQVAIYLAVCYYAARRLGRVWGSGRAAILTYAFTALNPILLIYTTTLLTDSLSASLLYLAFVLAIPRASDEPESATTRDAALSALLAGFAVMVRPGNAAAFLALLLVWLLRAFWRRDVPRTAVPLLALAAVLPFVPQVMANYRARGQLNPLTIERTYDSQVAWGLGNLKYATVVIGETGTLPPGQDWRTADLPRGARVAPDGQSWDTHESVQMFYKNPLTPPGVHNSTDFMTKSPLGYLATLALHGFGLVDQDYPFPYVRDYTPWYRWPLALVNFPFLIVAVAGTIGGVVRCYGSVLPTARLTRQPAAVGAADQASAPAVQRSGFSLTIELPRREAPGEHRSPVCLALGASALVSGAYLALYLPTAVEVRFGLPLYLLWMPGFIYGVWWLTDRVRERGWGSLRPVGVGMLVALVGALAISVWIWEQGPGPRARVWDARETHQMAPPAATSTPSTQP
jgi:hypothetical protein